MSEVNLLYCLLLSNIVLILEHSYLCHFLLENDATLNIPLDIVPAALPKVKPDDLENHLMVYNPSVTLKVTSCGGAIVSVQFTSK